jgi:hypothetical protein
VKCFGEIIKGVIMAALCKDCKEKYYSKSSVSGYHFFMGVVGVAILTLSFRIYKKVCDVEYDNLFKGAFKIL